MRAGAKERLVLYFRLIAAKVRYRLASDQEDEIRDLVDDIVRAAVQETIAQIRQNPRLLALDDGTYAYVRTVLKERQQKLDRLNAFAAELGIGKPDSKVRILEEPPKIRLNREKATDD